MVIPPGGNWKGVFDKFYRRAEGRPCFAPGTGPSGPGPFLARLCRGDGTARFFRAAQTALNRSGRGCLTIPLAGPAARDALDTAAMNAPAIKVLGHRTTSPPIRKIAAGWGLEHAGGYDILEGRPTGKIALEKLAEGPALIILDLGLPDIQGHGTPAQ